MKKIVYVLMGISMVVSLSQINYQASIQSTDEEIMIRSHLHMVALNLHFYKGVLITDRH